MQLQHLGASMKPVLLLLAVSALAFGQVPPMIPSAPDGGPVGGAGNLTTVGSVPYVSASGILNQDAGQFFWDATNNRLGLGTATPGVALDVTGVVRAASEANAINTINIGLVVQRTSNDSQLSLSYKATPDAWVIGSSYNSTGAYKPIALATSDLERMRITASGNVGIGTAIPGYKLEVAGSSNTEIARVGDGTRSFGISTYTPNSGGVTFKNSGTGLISLTAANAVLIGTGYAGLGSGVPANTVAIEGNVGIGTTTPVYLLDVAKSGVSGTFRAYDQTATTGSTLAVFRAGVAQSGNVLEVQNNAGSNVLSVTSTGALTSAVSIGAGGNISAGPTQDLGWSTRSTMTSPSGGIITLYNNAQTDFNRLQFGGTTSSFPSIQRSTTKLFFRLADDSAGATVRAGGYESSDGTAGATVTTCTGFKNGLCISGT